MRRDDDRRKTDEAAGDDERGGELRALWIADEVIRLTARDDPRMGYLLALREQLESDEHVLDEARQAITEFEEAYAKLTAPANRVAVYLGSIPDADDGRSHGLVRIGLGEQDYITNVDPKLGDVNLAVGTQVRVNEAYAVIGDLGVSDGGQVVKVAAVEEGGRLRVGTDPQSTQTRLVLRADSLRDEPIKQGSEVRMEPNFRVAVAHHAAAEVQDYYLEEIREIPWDAVGGQHDAIAVIKDAIEMPLLHPELYQRFGKAPPKGILLYGPPGCGKTLIGKATAWNLTQEYRKLTGEDVHEYFMYISGPRILNMWLGESERMVREVFAQAREKSAEGRLVFIFIDEAESLLRTRSSGRWLNISNTIVPQFCAEMDGMVDLKNVVVMLTSNRPDYIDPAVLRAERIDRKVKVGRPNRRAAHDIFGIYLRETPVDPGLVVEHKGDEQAAREELVDLITDFVFRTAGDAEYLEVFLRNGGTTMLHWRDLISGALIKSIVERAKDLAIHRSVEKRSDAEGVSLEDLREAARLEYRENEIFPKGDALEDWLKLLDHESEQVATIRPVRGRRAADSDRRSII